MADPETGVAARGPLARLRPESFAMTLLLTVLVAFGAISNNMVLPALPALAQVFDVAGGVAVLTITAFFVGFGVGQLVYGSVSDRFGRRPVLITGLALYTLASGACLAAPDMETLMGARFLQGLAAASTQVLARAIVRDLYTPVRAARVLSVMSAAFAFASAFAPLAGGLVQALVGWRGIFAALAAIGAGTLAVVWLGFGESLASRDATATNPRRIAANYTTLARSRAFTGYTLTFAAIFAGMFAFHSGSSFVFIGLLGYGPEVFGLFFALVIGGYFAGTVLSARITMRIGLRRLVAAGIAVSALAGGAMLVLILAGVVGALSILVPQFAFMFGVGLVLPNAISGALGPFPEKAGAASALLGFTQQSAGALMVAFLGMLADGTAAPMAGCIFAGALLALACFAAIVPRAESDARGTGVP